MIHHSLPDVSRTATGGGSYPRWPQMGFPAFPFHHRRREVAGTGPKGLRLQRWLRRRVGHRAGIGAATPQWRVARPARLGISWLVAEGCRRPRRLASGGGARAAGLSPRGSHSASSSDAALAQQSAAKGVSVSTGYALWPSESSGSGRTLTPPSRVPTSD